MSTQTITEFLEARIAEDEAAAKAVTAEDWYGHDAWGDGPLDFYLEPGAGTPSRVLAECAAKRAIIALADEVADLDSSLMSEGGGWRWETDKKILRTIAAVYADHADYQQEWAL